MAVALALLTPLGSRLVQSKMSEREVPGFRSAGHIHVLGGKIHGLETDAGIQREGGAG